MKTPCVQVCQLDADGRRCTGCGRTLEEIARWAQMSDAERERVLDGLATRKERDEEAR